MRRMYGSLVEAEMPQPPQQQPLTPASTTFARSVRHFSGGSRFARSVDEGFLEDFILDDEYYNDLDFSFTSLNATGKEDDDFYMRIVHGGKGRNKRQAGFPGPDSKTDKNRFS